MRSWLGIGFVLACGGRDTVADELAVPDVEQATDYTCSASALQGVRAYYNVDLAEPALARELGATPQDGAPPEAIARVARAHGLDAVVRDGMTLAELAIEIAQRHPVIVDLQAWADPPRTTWADDWDDGHYVVLIAIQGDTLVFEDPSLAGRRAVLTAEELDARWHDADAGRRHVHTVVLFHTPPPASPRTVYMPWRDHME